MTNSQHNARVQCGNLKIAKGFYDFVVSEVLPGLPMSADFFWTALETVIADMAPKNSLLLAKRNTLQSEIDTWHQSHCDKPHDHEKYKTFL